MAQISINRNNTTYHYLLVLLNTSFGNRDPLVASSFKKRTIVLSVNLNYCMTLKMLGIPLIDVKFFLHYFAMMENFWVTTTIPKMHLDKTAIFSS